jgi:hypothetical protein
MPSAWDQSDIQNGLVILASHVRQAQNDWQGDVGANGFDLNNIGNLVFTGILTGGSGPTVITDSVGKILASALPARPEQILFIVGMTQGGVGGLALNLPATNGAEAVAVIGSDVLAAAAAFDDTTSESVQGSFQLPTGWTGTVDCELMWRAAAITGGVTWKLQVVAVDAGGLVNATLGTAEVQAAEAPAGTTLQLVRTTFDDIDTSGWGEGKVVFFKLYRDPADAGDTMTGDAQLFWLRFKLARNVEGAGGGGGLSVASYQTGFVSSATSTDSGEDLRYVDITISAIDVTKTLVMIQGGAAETDLTARRKATAGTASVATYELTGRLTSPTNLRISAPSGAVIAGRWQVLEYN